MRMVKWMKRTIGALSVAMIAFAAWGRVSVAEDTEGACNGIAVHCDTSETCWNFIVVSFCKRYHYYYSAKDNPWWCHASPDAQGPCPRR